MPRATRNLAPYKGVVSRLWAALILIAISMHEMRALACATCGCGDPTLTTLGAERPYPWRVRAAIGLQGRTDALGQPGVNQEKLRELRTDLYLAVAPTSKLFVQLAVPMVARSTTAVNGARTNTFGLGDVDLRVKPFVLQDREFAPRHLLALLLGMKLPTAPRQNDANGKPLPIELQPGTGSWDPILGLSYAYFAGKWSTYASLTFTAPAWSRDELRASPSLRTSTVLQYQLFPALAFRGGIDTRIDDKAYEGGRSVRDSGGFVGFLSPEIVVAPKTDWLLALAVRVPVVNALVGSHREGPLLGFTVAHDF